MGAVRRGMLITLTIPQPLADKLIEESRESGLPVEGLVVEKLLTGLNPLEKAITLLEMADALLREAEAYVEKGDLRGASRRIWDSCLLAVRAYVYWRNSGRAVSKPELETYRGMVEEELGSWACEVLNTAYAARTNLYDGWATRRGLESILRKTRKMVRIIRSRVSDGED